MSKTDQITANSDIFDEKSTAKRKPYYKIFESNNLILCRGRTMIGYQFY